MTLAKVGTVGVKDDELPDESDNEGDNSVDEATMEAKRKELTRLKEHELSEVVLAEHAQIQPRATTRWGIDRLRWSAGW